MATKHVLLALTVMAVLGVAPLVGACHTTAGAGEDVSKTGQAIKNSAQKNTP